MIIWWVVGFVCSSIIMSGVLRYGCGGMCFCFGVWFFEFLWFFGFFVVLGIVDFLSICFVLIGSLCVLGVGFGFVLV